MGDLRFLAAAILMVLAGIPGPAAGAVADDALLHFISMSAWTQGDPPSTGRLLAQVEPTGDAPEGPLDGRIEFLIEDLDGIQPTERIDVSFTIDVGTEDPEHGGRWRNVETEWIPGPGLYNVTATLWADGASTPWDSRWTWHAAGRSPGLGTGWGHASFGPSSWFDVDGDGAPDVWITDNETGAPLPRSLQVYESVRMASELAEWSVQCGRGLEFGFGPESEAVARVRIAASLVEVLAPGSTPLRMDTQSLGATGPTPVNGSYEVTLGDRFYGTRSDHVFFARTCAPAPPRTPHTWGDGFRTVANVTHWDLDADGAMDVRFWHTNASSVEGARNETLATRRGQELVLIAQAHVEHRATRRILTFELARPGGGHEGAWVEIQDAAGMFRELLGAPDNASVSYRLSLPANESFVEQDGNTTWAWIGHFSTQTLTVILDEAHATTGENLSPTQGTSSSSSRTSQKPESGSPIPGAGMQVALAAVGAALLVARNASGRR